MDILISSNLERLLFFASDFNDKLVAELMGKLNTEGSYKVAEDVFAKIEAEFDAAAATTVMRLIPSTSCGRTRTTCAIRTPQLPFVYTRTTAHAPATKRDRDRVHRVSVQVLPLGYRALGGTLENDDVTQLEVLSQLTGVPAPAPLAALAGKTPRFDRVVDKADILSTVGLLKDL